MKEMDELQQLKGVGAVLAKRLRDAGLTSFQRIVEGGEAPLRAIKGINQRSVPGMVQQAALLAEMHQQSPDAGTDDVASKVERMRDAVQALGRHARDRFAGKISGKTGRRLSENLVRIADALERIERSPKHRRKYGKGLAKLQAKMEKLDQAGLKKFCRGLKKSRKALTELAR